jgi:hypothetical protein
VARGGLKIKRKGAKLAKRRIIVEYPGCVLYVRAMSQTLETRVAQLEKEVAELSKAVKKKDWRRTVGIFKNDADFEEAARLGREYREQQTYEKEIAGS